jgi:hypothetical protein
MGRKTVLRFAAGTVVVFALAACGGGGDGGDGGGDGTTTAVAGTSTPEEYAAGVCGALQDWLDTIQTRGTTLGEEIAGAPSIEDGKQLLVTFLGDLAADTQTMIDTVEDLGAPDVEGGAEAHTAILGAFGGAQDAFEQAQAATEAIPPDDPQAFAEQTAAIGEELAAAGEEAVAPLGLITAPALDEAFANEPSCQQLGVGL